MLALALSQVRLPLRIKLFVGLLVVSLWSILQALTSILTVITNPAAAVRTFCLGTASFHAAFVVLRRHDQLRRLFAADRYAGSHAIRRILSHPIASHRISSDRIGSDRSSSELIGSHRIPSDPSPLIGSRHDGALDLTLPLALDLPLPLALDLTLPLAPTLGFTPHTDACAQSGT